MWHGLARGSLSWVRARRDREGSDSGTVAAWVTATVAAGVTQCSGSDAGSGGGGANRGDDSNWWQLWEKVVMARVAQGTGD